MIKIPHVILLLVSLMIVTSCGDVLINEKDEVVFHKISELEQQIEKEDWEKAKDNINELEQSHQHRKWKMQLLGGVSDIEEIETELEKLKISIRGEEKLDAKAGLAVIKYRMYLIYNL